MDILNHRTNGLRGLMKSTLGVILLGCAVLSGSAWAVEEINWDFSASAVGGPPNMPGFPATAFTTTQDGGFRINLMPNPAIPNHLDFEANGSVEFVTSFTALRDKSGVAIFQNVNGIEIPSTTGKGSWEQPESLGKAFIISSTVPVPQAHFILITADLDASDNDQPVFPLAGSYKYFISNGVTVGVWKAPSPSLHNGYLATVAGLGLLGVAVFRRKKTRQYACFYPLTGRR